MNTKMRFLRGVVWALVLAMSSVSVGALSPLYAWLNTPTIDVDRAEFSSRYSRGQCMGMTPLVQLSSGPTVSQEHCVVPTSWGAVTDSNLILTSVAGTFKTLSLPQGYKVLPSPDSLALFIAKPTANGQLQVGYVTNPKNSLSSNPLAPNTHMLSVPVQYFPETFSAVGFSNDSTYLVGISGNEIVRISLRNTLSRSRINIRSSNVAPSALKVITVTMDGSLVFASDNAGTIVAYEFSEACPDKQCQQRTVTEKSMVEYYDKESLYVADDASAITLFSSPARGNVSSVRASPVIEKRPVTYMALGDSYSSGEGTWSYKDGNDGTVEYPKEKCHQSSSAFTDIYARRYQHFTDRPVVSADFYILSNMEITEYRSAACAGATTTDVAHENDEKLSFDKMYKGQFDQAKSKGTPENLKVFRADARDRDISGRIAQQEFLKKYQPDIATVGIGGNDVQFGSVIAACTGKLSTCAEATLLRPAKGAAIHNLFNTLVKTYERLHEASPRTRLFAVGYPLFISDRWAPLCRLNVPLDRNERTFIVQSTRYLNDVIEAAAKKAGITYIDLENTLGNNILCGTETGYVNGIALGEDIQPFPGAPEMIAQESFHPTESGYMSESFAMAKSYGELINVRNTNCPLVIVGDYCPNSSVTAPAVPSYFGRTDAPYTEVFNITTPVIQKPFFQTILERLRPSSFVAGMIHSTPRELGTFQVNERGELDASIPLPADLEPGYHTLFLSGTRENGEPFEYQQIIYYAPNTLQTGPCGTLPYANIDQDSDGIDDACDPIIDAENQILVEDPTRYLIYPNESRTPAESLPQAGTQTESSRREAALELSNTLLALFAHPAATTSDTGSEPTTTPPPDQSEPVTPTTHPQTTGDPPARFPTFLLALAAAGVGTASLVTGVVLWRRHSDRLA